MEACDNRQKEDSEDQRSAAEQSQNLSLSLS